MQASEIFIQHQMEENWRLANQAEQMRLVVATGNLLLATVLQIGIAFLGLGQRALLLTVWMVFLVSMGFLQGGNSTNVKHITDCASVNSAPS